MGVAREPGYTTPELSLDLNLSGHLPTQILQSEMTGNSWVSRIKNGSWGQSSVDPFPLLSEHFIEQSENLLVKFLPIVSLQRVRNVESTLRYCVAHG